MPISSPTALVLLVFFSSTVSAAQSSPAPREEATQHRTVELSTTGPRAIAEVRIHPELLTALLVSAPLRLAGMELEAREQFSRVSVVEDALLLVPSRSLEVGRRLRLRLRFSEGSVPESADFLLEVNALGAEQQINVTLPPPPVESCGREAEIARARIQQCEVELTRVRALPEGLSGLLASRLLDDTGVTVHDLKPGSNVTQQPGDQLRVTKARSYRSVNRVAVEMWLDNPSVQPRALTGAELVGADGTRLKVLRIWPREPIPPEESGLHMVVEAEAKSIQARGSFTLLLQQEGESPGATLHGVTFP